MKASTLGADMLCGWCACSPADQIFCISQVWTKWTEDQTIQFTRDEGFWRKSTVFVLQLKKAEIKLKFWTNEVLCWNFSIRRCGWITGKVCLYSIQENKYQSEVQKSIQSQFVCFPMSTSSFPTSSYAIAPSEAARATAPGDQTASGLLASTTTVCSLPLNL